MDIYDFIPSPDVAAHCRKLAHPFNPLERAVLVALSQKTLKERHEAWREILRGPDMPIHESLNFKPRGSLHEYLREQIAYDEKSLALFLTPGDGAGYSAKVFSPGRWEYEPVDGYLSTFEKALEGISERWDWEEDGVEFVDIRRNVLDEVREYQQARVNRLGEVIFLTGRSSEAQRDELEMIFIHIPAPFEKGDIVTHDGKEPCVLCDMVHWYKHYADYVTGKRGDGSDNCATCYRLTDDGALYCDAGPPFMTYHLRYYTGELKGQARFLECLSRHMKDDIDRRDRQIDYLLDAWHKFYIEAEQQRANTLFFQGYGYEEE